MRRRFQIGQIVRKSKSWHIRFYLDTDQGRVRKSVPVGPATGKEKLTKQEAQRRGLAVLTEFGINAEPAYGRVVPELVETVKTRVDWLRKNHPSWLEGKPGPSSTRESQLAKHVLPRFGYLAVGAITERMVQEWVTDLKRTTFERKKPDGTVFKQYTLSRKSVLLLVALVKVIVGRKIARDWDIRLGRAARPKQRFFTEDELRRIIEAAQGQARVLLATLAGTGLRIGEALGLQVADVDLQNGVIHVRRSIWRGQALEPKTDNALRQVDVDAALVAMLRQHLGDRTEGWVFPSRNDSPLAAENVRNRILSPLLEQLGIPKAGMHSFRHSRVTWLRKHGIPEHVIKQWIGHSALDKRITDTYCHTDQDLQYRQQIAGSVGLDRLFGPKGLVLDPTANVDAAR